ncbi:serine/threonine-protein kinase [Geothrix sp. PMB-07]|uniref:serine/threonine-protein kinase n=1 Tax=Geothrix sp. PMB-07 TaxID=3068640 RepID=UPI002741DEC8|nr:serine/threonine-protein kinase [Geothrix sp. PMB-07]WLT32414.1 serine/threonine-protein kinase [Geothrix sp. PMB-07]
MSAPDLESRLIELARQRGLLTETGMTQPTHPGLPASGAEGLTTESMDFGPRISALLRSGQIQHHDLQALIAELLQEPSFTATVGPGDEPGGTEALSWLGYKDLRILGAGVNALVYRAHDPQLGRWVALKFPQAGRFVVHLLKEARAQASVDHPHVLKVLEVGEHQDRPFIALQLVEGGSLLETASAFSIETRARLIKDVAEGLQAAHDQGLLHLDLKPDNILVDTSDPGRPWAYLTDFGQVMEASQVGGQRCLGAIPYASPEQLAGDAARLDRRSDVFALGATLYTVLAGAPPFDTLDPVARQHTTPVPLRRRNAKLPEDLEAITRKCLNRQPEDRYPSAKALADDLQRYLEGRPVSARPARATYVLGKWAFRNRGLASLGVATLLLLTGLGAWNLLAARRQALHLLHAERSAKDVEGMEQQLRFAHLARLHDRRPAVAKVRETMARILQDMATGGREAFGPCAYALGMGHASLGEWDEARSMLHAAWSHGFRTPACAQAWGEVLTRLFVQGKAAIRVADPQQRQQETQKLQVEFRDPALTSFQAAREGGLHTRYQDAMMAYLKGDRSLAMAEAEAASREASWHYQTDLLRCAILNEQAKEAMLSGDHPAAQRHYLAKLAIAENLVRIAPSDPSNWIVLGDTHWNLWNTDQSQPWMERAAQSYEMALQADPGFPAAYGNLSATMAPMARAADQRGESPLPIYDRGVALAEQGLRHTPADRMNPALCEALLWRAQGIGQLGGDPRPDLERANQVLQELTSRFQPDEKLCNLHVALSKNRAIAAFDHGEDPLPLARETLRWAEELVRFAPGSISREMGVLRERIDIAEWEMELGEPFSTPPVRLEQQSIDLLARLVPAAKSLRRLCLTHLGKARLFKAEELQRSGGDPIPAYQAAMSAFREGIQADPERAPFAQIELANGATWVGTGLQAHGSDPKPLLQEGLVSAQQALASKPHNQEALIAEHMLSYLLARCEGSATRERTGLNRLRQWVKQHPQERRSLQIVMDRWQRSP